MYKFIQHRPFKKLRTLQKAQKLVQNEGVKP